MSGPFHLLKTRRFLPFFGTQFLGAFNDNLFKNSLIVLLTFNATSWTSMSVGVLANLAAGIFILPFFLFSATAGQLADKYDKASLARLVKLLEISIMLLAGVGFAMHSLIVLFTVLFLFGVHSTLFGPVKYAILPQHLEEAELVGGNALVEAGTFVAILIGTLSGGLIAGLDHGTLWITGVGLAVAAAGYLSSRKIPAAPAPDPELRVSFNVFVETWHNINFARENRTVFLSILGISWFWLYGALFLAQFPAYAKTVLGGSETTVTLLLATFTLGIGIGSILCERLSGKMVEIGLVPFGSIGLTLFGLDLAWASPALPATGDALSTMVLLANRSIWRVLFDLGMLGLFGGLFIVPMYALVQIRSNPAHRARIIAANNIMNALFMVVGATAAAGLLSAGLSIPMLFAVAAVCNAAVAIYIYKLVPEFLVRFVVWLLIHSVYRLDKRGLKNIPESGPAVVICNHVSFVDALIIAAASRRPIRFVMDHRIFRWPIFSFVFKATRAIPIAPEKEDAALKKKAFDDVAEALAAGEVVGIFPEGRITATGEMSPFRPGITQIISRSPVPVIPMGLSGLWGSIFSRMHGSALSKPWKARPFRKIALVVGVQVLPEKVTLQGLQAEVVNLCSKQVSKIAKIGV
jgi:1-acyl-sn-glycerol-3-phosphate acyltransferase